MQHIIHAEGISKSFGTLQAVHNLNLQVQSGEIYGFLGPNGSGKSTTLRIILSLLKPDSGTVSIAGFSVSKDRAKALQQVGCIIEKPDFQPYLSAEDNLKIFARMHGCSTKTADIHALLQRVVCKVEKEIKQKLIATA
jgi:ABC-2 type transport system ATP-binding protein